MRSGAAPQRHGDLKVAATISALTEALVQEAHPATTTSGGGFGARVVEEGVTGALIDVDLGRLALFSELGAQLIDVGLRDDRVVGSEQAEVRAAQARHELERADRLCLAGLAIAQHPVPADAGGEAVY